MASSTETETPEVDRRRSRLIGWLPMAIVVASILAAIMGWRASVADEHSNHDNELSRQELIRQQQLQLGDIQEINTEARAFGDYEQQSLLNQTLRREAKQVHGTLSSALGRQADDALALAASLQRRVTLHNAIEFSAQDGVTFNPAYPYRIAVARRSAALENVELAALDPERLRHKAEDIRRQGEDLTGLAALFIAAIVFFTLAAVSAGRTVRSFGVAGAAVTVIGVIIFIAVEVS